MERIVIDTDQLDKDIRDITDELDRMNTKAQRLYDAVMELNSMWTGPANAALVDQFTKDRQVLLDYLTFITQYIRELETARTDYNNCDSWVRSTIAAIRI